MAGPSSLDLTGGPDQLEELRATIRVLVADDDAVFVDTMRELIARRPSLVLVSVARDAAEASDAAERLRPDVAILDVRMPGGGGVEAARRIRTVSPATAILALSAHQDRATVESMLAAGAAGYLVKGVASIVDIVSAIEHAARACQE